MQYISHSVSDTEAFGRQLAQQLHPNTVVACRGGLAHSQTAAALLRDWATRAALPPPPLPS